jgi:uncharacterized protein
VRPIVPSVVIRPAVATDFETICALNLAEVQHTSAMDMRRLAELNAISCYHRVACLGGIVSAFLLAMCNGCPYENDNFEWFSKKYARFIYVDRVVVSAAARGMGLGSLLYEDVFTHGRSNAIPLVTCEFISSSASRNKGLSGWQMAPRESHFRPQRPNIRFAPTLRRSTASPASFEFCRYKNKERTWSHAFNRSARMLSEAWLEFGI